MVNRGGGGVRKGGLEGLHSGQKKMERTWEERERQKRKRWGRGKWVEGRLKREKHKDMKRH